MSVELLIANLLRVAKEDLDGAKLLGASSNRNAIYLCEQAAEKVIRAVATSEGKHAGIKHEPAEIVDLIPEENPLKLLPRKVEHLSQYARIAIQYRRARPSASPSDRAPPSCTKPLVNTATALDGAIKAFRVDMGRADTSAAFVGPIR
jgi:HEPN domain-containing protein